jgi:hypothetical protein
MTPMRQVFIALSLPGLVPYQINVASDPAGGRGPGAPMDAHLAPTPDC